MQKRIGVIGHMARGDPVCNGQVEKTQTLVSAITNLIGAERVRVLDMHQISMRRMGAFLAQCRQLVADCDVVVMLPANRSLRVLAPVCARWGKRYGTQLHYAVVGGWLDGYLRWNPVVRRALRAFSGIHVETQSMKRALLRRGYSHVHHLPNCIPATPAMVDTAYFSAEEAFRLCTFSRVMRKKGIEEAVRAVSQCNAALGRTACTLDIYGTIEPAYRKRFEGLARRFPSFVRYQGVVAPAESAAVLSGYFALLFPTCYEGEGFPGTILHAMAAGLPVIATDWRYNAEILSDDVGVLYSHRDKNALPMALMEIIETPESMLRRRAHCRKMAEKYTAESVFAPFLHAIGALQAEDGI